jgi:hypothetical protein
MSAVALIISLVTFYSGIRIVDELQMIPSATTGLVALLENKQYALMPKHSITFVNSGTRQVAVMQIGLVFEHLDKRAWRKCNLESKSIIKVDLDHEPFIVKPFEMAVKILGAKTTNLLGQEVKEDPLKGWFLNQWGQIGFVPPDPEHPMLLSCAVFDISTADGTELAIVVPLVVLGAGKNGEWDMINWRPGRAITLMSRSNVRDFAENHGPGLAGIAFGFLLIWGIKLLRSKFK